MGFYQALPATSMLVRCFAGDFCHTRVVFLGEEDNLSTCPPAVAFVIAYNSQFAIKRMLRDSRGCVHCTPGL